MPRTLAFLLALVLTLALRGETAAGAVITVTTPADIVADDGLCSLREAVTAANNNTAIGGCPAGSDADIIRISPALPAPVTILLGGKLELSGALSLEGGTGAPLILQANAPGSMLRILPQAVVAIDNAELRGAQGPITEAAVVVESNALLTLTRVAITGSRGRAVTLYGGLIMRASLIARNELGIFTAGGALTLENTDFIDNAHDAINASSTVIRMVGGVVRGNGSGIATSYQPAELIGVLIEGNAGMGAQNYGGSLTLTDSIVRGNAGWGPAVGIFWPGTRGAIINCEITGNTTTAGAGMAAVVNEGDLVIENSAVIGNVTDTGGIRSSGPLTATNVTVSGNVAREDGAGILTWGDATLRYLTLVDNASARGGGNLRANRGAVTVAGSLFRHAAGHANCSVASGVITFEGGNVADDATCGDAFVAAELRLSALTPGGGKAPRVHALLVGSPAIDRGASPHCPATDQRGVARPQGADCDAGAYEAGATHRWLPLVHGM